MPEICIIPPLLIPLHLDLALVVEGGQAAMEMAVVALLGWFMLSGVRN